MAVLTSLPFGEVMDERFIRSDMVLGIGSSDKLSRFHAAVFGLGGVGSWAAEALARAGVGKLTLVDHDTVSLSNINRQAEALESTLGMAKARAMAARLKDINPSADIRPVAERYGPETRELFFSEGYDYIIDAIDLVSCKLDLIITALRRGIPVISALGTGNKLDPTLFRVTDISISEGCPFARIVRKELRSRGVRHHKVLWSPEKAVRPSIEEEPPPGRRSVPGSVPWVTACAGMMLAGEAVKDLLKIAENLILPD